jgi:carboxylate-amine ligase
VPRWFRDWEDFSFVARDLTAAAGVPDYTYFWWDVRPHPRLGTVEVRAPDAQFCAARAAGLAALVHALAAMEADRPPPAYESREAIEEACYQATRYGLEAWLPDHRGGRRTAAALARELLREVRPYARDLGCDAELAEVRRILREGNGADVQRRVHAEGGIYGLLKWLTERQV